MAHDAISLSIADVSAFARALRREVADSAGHQIWLNRIARAAGYRNYQHLSALRRGAEAPADARLLARARRSFDAAGRFAHWPARTQMQHLCLWAVWAHLPAASLMTEREVSRRINACTVLEDAALIRRTMVETGMVTRDQAGTAYQRVERTPPSEGRALIAALRQKAPA